MCVCATLAHRNHLMLIRNQKPYAKDAAPPAWRRACRRERRATSARPSRYRAKAQLHPAPACGDAGCSVMLDQIAEIAAVLGGDRCVAAADNSVTNQRLQPPSQPVLTTAAAAYRGSHCRSYPLAPLPSVSLPKLPSSLSTRVGRPNAAPWY